MSNLLLALFSVSVMTLVVVSYDARRGPDRDE